jgi:transcriptional regulator with XRE-family HTH domain
MAKAQHAPEYRDVPKHLRALRERAGLTQRALGGKLRKPQSWVYNCESANRRVDVGEFALWSQACGVEPLEAFAQFLGIPSGDNSAERNRRRARVRR